MEGPGGMVAPLRGREVFLRKFAPANEEIPFAGGIFAYEYSGEAGFANDPSILHFFVICKPHFRETDKRGAWRTNGAKQNEQKTRR